MISIIVPVYNVEKYLKKCVDSILNQTCMDFEVILVDDGSPDNCPQICDEYVRKDPRVKVIHKENGGLISAWSTGVKKAQAENIAFIDSDDWVSARYLEIMVDALSQTQVDIVSCQMTKVWGDKMVGCGMLLPAGFYDSVRMKQEVYPVMLNAGDFEQRGIQMSRGAKIVRKTLILENLKYLDERVTYAEDVNTMFPVLLSANSLFLVEDPECMYFYRYNPASMLNAYDRNRLHSISHVHPTLLKICEEKKHPEMVPQVYADFLAASVQYFKNELINPVGMKAARNNIREFVQRPMLRTAIETVEWKHYRKLNVLIILCMKDYNQFHQWITTGLLKLLKIIAIKHKASL